MKRAARIALAAPVAFITLAGAPSGQTPSFEVASVKANAPGFDSRTPQRASFTPDGVTFANQTLHTLIRIAYGVWDIKGGPEWIGRPGPPSAAAARFDVHAKAAAATTRDQLLLMVRSLLAERFTLRVHMEHDSQDVLALVVARRDGRLGPNLRRASADCPSLEAAAAAGVDPCGRESWSNALVTGSMKVNGMSLDALELLRLDAGQTIVDKTGLSGAFDWELRWTPQAFLQRSFDRARYPTIDPEGPSIFTALQEQLGLRLVSEKGQREVLVIDHAERPSPD